MRDEVDYGAEDYEFPRIENLDPHEAAAIWDQIEREATRANKRAARLKERPSACPARTGAR
jgi:hypothetical protein